ncbi:MAG TPA: rRNA maturation RNase YbeY [Thermomicrobiaceae bacterium]|nr:rRNA maturation RNase YbeY [Thermomicrobiaceae bacterium]
MSLTSGSPFSVEIRLNPTAPSLNTDRVAALLDFAARQQAVSGEVGLWVCDDAEMTALHQQFMGLSGPTDVMSFPGEGDYLGDIAVSFETAARQAPGAGHSVQREIAYLALHGFLHLLGFDDLTPAERTDMLTRQDALLDAFERGSPGDWV